ncbi:MAG: glycine--tRNA ligase subunit beta [Thermoleophilia bacterium]|jgi:glycyl-tRNA synthetase beta chain
MNTKADPVSRAGDFLFEIGTEELPAAAARSAAQQVPLLAGQVFARNYIEVEPDAISVWVTPRRIAIFIEKLTPMQQAQEKTERGPVASRAFDEDGEPTGAAEGFARAKGVAVGDLEVREHEGQEFVFAVHRREGQPTIDLLPEICREILMGISFSKTMHWDGADMRFSRPVRWLVTKYASQTIEYEVAGIRSTDTSQGHRFLADPDVVIEDASSYRELMSAASVMVDQEARRLVILEGLAMQAGKEGASYIDPAGELEEVIYLVENPSVQKGRFAEEHLRLPDRVLTTCMQSHQRYFPLTREDGSLVDGFLYVINGDPACAEGITEGNERVLEGRIEDAEFSFDKDLVTGIEKMAENLEKVVFHQKLGSLADKSARLDVLVKAFAGMTGLGEADLKIAASAARLAKADQVSIMVQEFPTLEGYIGSVYANLEGFPSDVCKAIEEHFLPLSAGGALPTSVQGAVLSICDKIDNLTGAFAINELPTGSRDPYGLRRAAVGIAAISNRFSFDFDLIDIFSVGHRAYTEQKADILREPGPEQAAFDFVCDRIQQQMVEKGTPVEIMEAARAAGLTSLLRLMALADALDEFRNTKDFDDLHTAYFRCSKIVAKAGEKAGIETVDASLFEEEAEKGLYTQLVALEPQIKELAGSLDYGGALAKAAAIRAAVDLFFDDVMIMAEDEKIRNNRLALVKRTASMLLTLGDPMRVAAAPKAGSGS